MYLQIAIALIPIISEPIFALDFVQHSERNNRLYLKIETINIYIYIYCRVDCVVHNRILGCSDKCVVCEVWGKTNKIQTRHDKKKRFLDFHVVCCAWLGVLCNIIHHFSTFNSPTINVPSASGQGSGWGLHWYSTHKVVDMFSKCCANNNASSLSRLCESIATRKQEKRVPHQHHTCIYFSAQTFPFPIPVIKKNITTRHSENSHTITPQSCIHQHIGWLESNNTVQYRKTT